MKRALGTPGWLIGCAATAALWSACAGRGVAQVLPIERVDVTEHVEHFRRMKLFDFDERAQGNYESTPMHWERIEGPGMPEFAEAAFDFGVGRREPPSYRLHTELGSVAAEYAYPDMDVIPGADYLIVGYVRAEKVQRSRAFITAYFVNRIGELIPESKRVGPLIKSTGESKEPWQRVMIRMPGDQRDAHGLRLQVWLLQSAAWRDPPPDAVDPIIREDVNPTAWFDDIAIYRLPRAQLTFNKPSNLLRPGEAGAVLIDVHNSTDQILYAELNVADPAGKTLHTTSIPLTPNTTMPVAVELPPLPPETYTARLNLTNGTHTLIERRLNFAVLNELPFDAALRTDVGAALPPQRIYDPQRMHDLLTGLQCGLVRLPIPMIGPLDSERKLEQYREWSELTKALSADRMLVAGMLVAPNAAYAGRNATPTHRILARDPTWPDRVNPLLAQHLGRLITMWQLGAAEVEAHEPDWTPALVEQVRTRLAEFVSLPQVVLPQSLLRPRGQLATATAHWAPPELPTRSLPLYLEQFADHDAHPRWLVVEPGDAHSADQAARITDLARRVALAKALDPDRLIVSAPLTLSEASGRPQWEPSPAYVVLRTLCHYLGGKRGVGALQLDGDGVALIFDGRAGSCVVLWTWRSEPLEAPVSIYLGEAPALVDLWGQRRPVEIRDGQAHVHLTPTPQILVDVDAPLALLQASFELSPTYVQIHDPTPPPQLRFRNYYDQPLQGHLLIEPPKSWEIVPNDFDIDLAAGAEFEQPLQVIVPQRHPAAEQRLRVRMTLSEPSEAELEFDVPIMVGLRDVAVEVAVRWENEALVVRHSLRNLSEAPVDFVSRCQAPLRPMVERAFLQVPPGESQTQVYVFSDPQIDELRGMPLHLRLEEVDGQRELTQVVEIPS